MFVNNISRNCNKVIHHLSFWLTGVHPPYEPTDFTPSMLLTEREMKLPVDLIFVKPAHKSENFTVPSLRGRIGRRIKNHS